MKQEITIDEIMDRLSRICYKRDVGVKVRPDFSSGPGKWHVYLSRVFTGSIESGGSFSGITVDCNSGATPEAAIRNVWQAVLSLEKSEKIAIVRLNCPSNVPIPGDEPQVWVRWNSGLDDWEDVIVERLSPDKLRSHKDQVWRDKLT